MNGYPLGALELDCSGNTEVDAKVSFSLELNDSQRLEAAMLHEENEHLRERLKVLRDEMALNATTTIAAEAEDRSLIEQERLLSLTVQTLDSRKSTLLSVINNLRLRSKAVQEDERASGTLLGLLAAELDDYTYEREIMLRKLRDLKDGIRRMERYNESVVPFGRRQDDLLRRAYLLLKEVQDRMELSIVLRQYAAVALDKRR